MRLLSIMEKVQSSSNGLDEKVRMKKSQLEMAPTASKQPTQQAVATNQAKTNTQKRKLANASVAVAAAAARNGPTRRDPSANFKKGTVQAGVASLPQHVLDDTKRKFLLIRQQLIQTPSHQIFDTVVEPAHTQWLCVGNIPVCIPQVGMHVWAFMDDINEIRKLGLPTNEKTKIGYYRAVIVGIQSGGNFIRVHWLSLGINNVDQNWYNIKRLRLWRPAATAVALFVFLESGGKHMITMPVNSQHQMLTRYCSLREALQRRYEAARTVSQRSFADAPMVSLADINYNFCITFPLETLGIGIDVEHSDGGIKVTSIHGSPNNPELHQAMQNIRPGDRIVAVRKQTPNGSNLTYTTINRDLKQLMLCSNSWSPNSNVFSSRRKSSIRKASSNLTDDISSSTRKASRSANTQAYNAATAATKFGVDTKETNASSTSSSNESHAICPTTSSCYGTTNIF